MVLESERTEPASALSVPPGAQLGQRGWFLGPKFVLLLHPRLAVGGRRVRASRNQAEVLGVGRLATVLVAEMLH